MTKDKLVEHLKIVALMGDKQIETLANLLIDYFSTSEKELGFKNGKKNGKI
jgi:hypothetical protein